LELLLEKLLVMTQKPFVKNVNNVTLPIDNVTLLVGQLAPVMMLKTICRCSLVDSMVRSRSMPKSFTNPMMIIPIQAVATSMLESCSPGKSTG
jgi:hypothetical protein